MFENVQCILLDTAYLADIHINKILVPKLKHFGDLVRLTANLSAAKLNLMIRNLFLIALRNFKKDRWYSLLNILGLTIGVTFSLFLVFYIRDELNYDRFNQNADRIYRVNTYIQEKDKNTDWTITQFPLAPAMKKDFPEVEEATRLTSRERTLFKNGENSFYETKIFYADSNIFKVFTVKFLEGDDKALYQPKSMVISKTLATKYFGKNASAVGKTLRTVYDTYHITGVIEDIPQNSHIRFDMLIPLSGSNNGGGGDNWGNFGYFTYFLLKPAARPEGVLKKLDNIYHKNVEPIFAQFNIKMRYDIEPITDIHLHSKLEREPEELGSMSYIWIFSAVAFFMLLIACINYMNLTTARSARRAKEIGIRKVTGSTRNQLVIQFLGESVLTAFIAVFLSALVVLVLLPSFNTISGKAFTYKSLLEPFNLLMIVGIGLFTGLLGGSYPAFYLAKFKPVSVLKGALSKASGNVNLRRTLVVFTVFNIHDHAYLYLDSV